MDLKDIKKRVQEMLKGISNPPYSVDVEHDSKDPTVFKVNLQLPSPPHIVIDMSIGPTQEELERRTLLVEMALTRLGGVTWKPLLAFWALQRVWKGMLSIHRAGRDLPVHVQRHCANPYDWLKFWFDYGMDQSGFDPVECYLNQEL